MGDAAETLNPAAEVVSLRELCDHAELEPETYSGRGMMGRQCLGVQCDSVVGFVSSILCAAREMCATYEQLEMTVEGIEDALGAMRQDSMRHNIILYFPGVPFDSESSEEDDE